MTQSKAIRAPFPIPREGLLQFLRGLNHPPLMSPYDLTYSNSKFITISIGVFEFQAAKQCARGTEVSNSDKCPVDVSISVHHVRMVFALCTRARRRLGTRDDDVHLVTAGDAAGGFPIRGAIRKPSIITVRQLSIGLLLFDTIGLFSFSIVTYPQTFFRANRANTIAPKQFCSGDPFGDHPFYLGTRAIRPGAT